MSHCDILPIQSVQRKFRVYIRSVHLETQWTQCHRDKTFGGRLVGVEILIGRFMGGHSRQGICKVPERYASYFMYSK
jgi:hypothetical protein